MKLFNHSSPPSPSRRHSDSSREARTTGGSEDRFTYRRNRTLTGSLSSDVTSVNEHHAELRSARVQTHALRRHRRRLLIILLGILLAAAALFYVIYESIATPQVLSATPITIDASLYEKKIQDYLAGHFFERTRFSINTAALTRYLQDNGCPEVASVSSLTRYDGFGKTAFTLTMRDPVVSWQTGGSRLYVDDQGYAFTRNYYPTPAVEVVDQTGIQASNNQVLASNRFLGYIGKVIGRIKEQGFTVSKVILPANTTRQLLISLNGVGYPIKFSIDRAAAEQVEDAVRAVQYLSSHGINPEYLDVRVSGRAFYK